MNYMKISKNDIANGDGVRAVLWVAGCSHHCFGCHNKETWDYKAGKPFDDNVLEELIEAINKPWISGLTLSGGDPLSERNMGVVLEVCKEVRTRCPNKTIWLYTGRTIGEADILYSCGTMTDILLHCDVVVDGEFDEFRRDISLKFRGSSNQRLIDVRKTIENKKMSLYGG